MSVPKLGWSLAEIEVATGLSRSLLVMHHDSHIACHDAVVLPVRADLIDGLLNRAVDHVGNVDAGLHRLTAAGAAGSDLIAQRDAELIARAFG